MQANKPTPLRNPTAACLALFIGSMITASCQRPIVIHSAEQPAPDKKDERQISVRGTAELELLPDRLDLHVVIREVHASPAKAVRNMRAKQRSLLEAVQKLAAPKSEFVTSSLRLADHYERIGDRQVKVGFEATTTLTITMQNFDLIGDYMQLGSDHGAQSMSTQFRNTEIIAKKAETRALAIEAARSKAEQMVSLSGGRLGAVTAIAEESGAQNYWAPQELANTVQQAQPASLERAGSALTLRMSVSISYKFDS
jgi:hypothetical protein